MLILFHLKVNSFKDVFKVFNKIFLYLIQQGILCLIMEKLKINGRNDALMDFFYSSKNILLIFFLSVFYYFSHLMDYIKA
jgi:hypothetical protein